MLMYGRNQHNIVKQLSSNKKKKKEPGDGSFLGSNVQVKQHPLGIQGSSRGCRKVREHRGGPFL